MSFYKHFYNQEAPTTAMGAKIVARENSYYLSLIRRYFHSKGIAILEIGVGKGDFAKACSRAGTYDYTGIEANSEQAQHLQSLGYRVNAGLVPPISFPDNSFDLVFANQVIEHMPTGEAAINFIQEISRVLKPNGYVFIGAPDFFMYREGFYDNDYTHNFVTTVTRISQLLEDHDFKNIHQDYITLSLRGQFITGLISLVTRFAFWTGLPYLLFSRQRAHNIRYSMLRGFFIFARKLS